MKNLKYLILLFLFVNISCLVKNEENLNDFLFEGKAVDNVTNEPVSNIEIDYEVCNPRGSGIFGICVTKDEGMTLTDENGEFSVLVHYEEKDNSLKFFTRSKNINYQANSLQQGYSIEKLMNDGLPDIKVNRYASIKITVRNTNPFNEEDNIRVGYFRDDEESLRRYGLVRQSLINYENTNVFYDNGNTVTSILEWNGVNVHSVVEGKVNGAYRKVYLDYTIKKNGVYENKRTEAITLSPDIVNEYLIEY
ncbi:hypothetical protein [Tenacibaculum sp. 190524A05c]|uniref:Carboxypeptidase regulatory-like domain-containing protein n=1 Tax=Tenacibaculum platacis TaxID=3137852 RepID=A0ABM9NVV8_9FLAO